MTGPCATCWRMVEECLAWKSKNTQKYLVSDRHQFVFEKSSGKVITEGNFGV